MIVYHYTTIDALAMIMSTRSIKFNRLDKVDDTEEQVAPSNIRLWQYMFVSCWTENPEESIPLWRMYSDSSRGVRIGMEIDMFEDNIIGGDSVPKGIPTHGFLISKIPAEDIFREDYFISPIGTKIENKKDTLFYCHIDYVDDVKEKTKDAFQLRMTDTIHASSNISFGEIGKYKNKRWAFQEESRFRLLVFPFNPILNDPDSVGTIAINAFHDNRPVPISEYFLKIKQESLNKMEITLHPNISDSDRVIVEALCSKYAPSATIKDSELTDKLRMK